MRSRLSLFAALLLGIVLARAPLPGVVAAYAVGAFSAGQPVSAYRVIVHTTHVPATFTCSAIDAPCELDHLAMPKRPASITIMCRYGGNGAVAGWLLALGAFDCNYFEAEWDGTDIRLFDDGPPGALARGGPAAGETIQTTILYKP